MANSETQAGQETLEAGTVSQPSENHRHLDGRKFVKWLYEVRPDIENRVNTVLGATICRRLYGYGKGTNPDAYDVPDRICVKLGLHLDDIPDDIWLLKSSRGRKPMVWEQRRAKELLGEGFYPAEVARLLNVAPSSVHRWVDREAA